MSKRHLLLIVLKRTGAFKHQHNKRMGLTVGEHLTNTYDDLKRMGASEDVALAGGMSSLYGTNSFRTALLMPDQRPIIRGLFGDRTERLAWLFGTINRPMCFEGESMRNWRTGEDVKVSDEDLYDLRLIEVANLSDNGVKLTNYPNLERFNEERQVPK